MLDPLPRFPSVSERFEEFRRRVRLLRGDATLSEDVESRKCLRIIRVFMEIRQVTPH
jgi:hypothetical protein